MNHAEASKKVIAELQRTMKKEFEFTDQVLECALTIIRKCEGSEVLKSTPSSFHVTFIMYVRAYNSALAAYELIKNGFPYHSIMICRSLFNDFVNIKYLNQDDSEKKAERYGAFRGLIRVRAIKQLREWKGDAEISLEMKAYVKEMQNKFQERFPGNKWDKDWSGLTDKEKAVKIGMLDDYILVSNRISSYLHGGPEGLEDAIKGTLNGKEQYWIGPRTDKTMEALVTVSGYLLRSLEVIVQKFEFEEEKKMIEELVKTCTEMFLRYRKVRNEA